MRAMSLGGIGFCLGTLCVATVAVAAEPVFQAGFAERDITPSVGMKALGGDGNAYLGPGNPDILEPAGPIDPQVGVLGAWNADGKFLGCIVNFACHGTTRSGGISADWIYYLEKTIRGLMGEQAIVVFMPGMLGDITQLNNRSLYQIRQVGEVAGRYVGGRVGAEAIKTLVAVEQAAGPLAPVTAQHQVLQIKRRAPQPERVARALELVQHDPAKVGATEWTFARELVILDAWIKKQPIADVEPSFQTPEDFEDAGGAQARPPISSLILMGKATRTGCEIVRSSAVSPGSVNWRANDLSRQELFIPTAACCPTHTGGGMGAEVVCEWSFQRFLPSLPTDQVRRLDRCQDGV